MNVQDLINKNKPICELAQKFGFINLRVFKGVIPSEEHILHILVDLDPNDKEASFVRLPLLENELEKNLGCVVSAALETTLQDFYKESILENCVSLEADDLIVAQVYGGDRKNFIFEFTSELIDECANYAFEVYNEQALGIMTAYDEEVKFANLNSQTKNLSIDGQKNFVSSFPEAEAQNPLSVTTKLLLNKYKG